MGFVLGTLDGVLWGRLWQLLWIMEVLVLRGGLLWWRQRVEMAWRTPRI